MCVGAVAIDEVAHPLRAIGRKGEISLGDISAAQVFENAWPLRAAEIVSGGVEKRINAVVINQLAGIVGVWIQ